MKNIKLYIYAGIAILIIALAAWGSITHKKLVRARADNIRYEYNQQQLLDQAERYKRLAVTRAQLLEGMTVRQDSLIRALKIKPKQIERVVERHHYHIDTVPEIVYIAALKEGDYPFIDKSTCFTFGGSIKVTDSLQLTVDRREYHNRTTEIAYLEREKKILFIRYGPWRAKLHIDNECGEDLVKELTVVKTKK